MALPNPLDPFVISTSLSVVARADRRTRKFCVVSSGDTNLGSGNSRWVSASDYASIITQGGGSNSVSYKACKAIFAQEEAQATQVLIYELTGGGSAQARLQNLENWIDSQKEPCWGYFLPSALVSNGYFGTMATKYAQVNNGNYFFFDLDNLPAQSSFFNSNCAGKKSCFAVYNTLTDNTISPAGIFMGILASAKYDVSGGNQMSPLNRKRTPYPSNSVAPSNVTALTNAPANWVGSVAGERVVLNGLFCDKKPLDFWFSYDSLCEILDAEMSALAVNSANIANAGLKFDDVGIRTIKTRIINILKNCQELGYITRFGKSLDLSSNEIISENEIGYIPANEFKAKFPENFKNGLYDAFSVYIEIAGFIQQIKLNVTI